VQLRLTGRFNGQRSDSVQFQEKDDRSEGTRETRHMSKVLKRINAVRKEERGAALVEYGLLVGLIAVVSLVVVTQLGLGISGKLSTACSSLGGGIGC
jgi:pilus assembly protein Flp/PilA